VAHFSVHAVSDASPPSVGTLLRRPFAAQELAIMGVLKRWQEAGPAAVIAGCGTGKTLIFLGATHCHGEASASPVDFDESYAHTKNAAWLKRLGLNYPVGGVARFTPSTRKHEM
jgi:hypothetical protein